MRKPWYHVSNLGITDTLETIEVRSIILANQIAIILTLLALSLTIVVWTNFGVTNTTPILILMLVIFVLIPVLNWKKQYNLSRLLLCNSIPIFALALALVSKLSSDTEVFEYFDSRIIIIISSVIPVIIFPVEEKNKLIFSLSVCFLLLILFDPIHNVLNIGFYQKGFVSRNYNFINFISVISFAFLVGSVLFLKNIIKDYEIEKEHLFTQLNQQNVELRMQNDEILDQRHELLRAKNLIEKQKHELSRQNKELELLIDEKSQDLIVTNKELVQHNNELQQFSYTISHNLRAPVASLIGLSNIFEKESLNDENLIILDHMRKSAESLDKVFRDLNKVLELRNTVASVKEKIVLTNEVQEIKHSLSNEIEASGIRVVEDYNTNEIFTIRPFFNSILYNLISNAIKYRNRRRKSFIRINSTKIEQNIVIKVEDNGLGMDIERHQSDLFKMYKRFHEHTEGKGLGLYLVKLQTEALGGTIDVKSKINEGTTFTITIKYLEDIHNQTIMENDFCRIFYDAFASITGIIGKREAQDEQFREAHLKSLEILRQYHTPNFILDIRVMSILNYEDKNWLLGSFFPEAIDCGLVKFALLTNDQSPDKELVEFLNRIKEISINLGNKFAVFHSTNEAKEWITNNG